LPRIILPKLLQIPLPVGTGPGPEIRKSIKKKAQPSPGPSHNSPAQPLHNLPKVIRTRNELEQPSPGHHVALPLALQPQQNPISPHINPHPTQKHQKPNQKPEPEKARGSIMGVVVGD